MFIVFKLWLKVWTKEMSKYFSFLLNYGHSRGSWKFKWEREKVNIYSLSSKKIDPSNIEITLNWHIYSQEKSHSSDDELFK